VFTHCISRKSLTFSTFTNLNSRHNSEISCVFPVIRLWLQIYPSFDFRSHLICYHSKNSVSDRTTRTPIGISYIFHCFLKFIYMYNINTWMYSLFFESSLFPIFNRQVYPRSVSFIFHIFQIVYSCYYCDCAMSVWPSLMLERFIISTSRSRLPLSLPADCNGLRPVCTSFAVRFRVW
jgi:hypothetical protein